MRKQQGRNGKRSNYFTQEIQKGGKNFLNAKNSRNMQFDSNRIFRDLVKGNIDVQQYEEYFSDPILLDAILSNSLKLYNENNIAALGINTIINYNNYNNIQYNAELYSGVFNKYRLAAEAYNIIFNYFSVFKNDHNAASLVPMMQHLSRYKYNL